MKRKKRRKEINNSGGFFYSWPEIKKNNNNNNKRNLSAVALNLLGINNLSYPLFTILYPCNKQHPLSAEVSLCCQSF